MMWYIYTYTSKYIYVGNSYFEENMVDDVAYV
jgi:hypothetical protein